MIGKLLFYLTPRIFADFLEAASVGTESRGAKRLVRMKRCQKRAKRRRVAQLDPTTCRILSLFLIKHCRKSVCWNTNVKVGDDRLDDCQVGGERLLQRGLLPRPPHQAGRRGQDQGALKVRSGGHKEMSSILADE
jgi:hypothetical protein